MPIKVVPRKKRRTKSQKASDVYEQPRSRFDQMMAVSNRTASRQRASRQGDVKAANVYEQPRGKAARDIARYNAQASVRATDASNLGTAARDRRIYTNLWTPSTRRQK